MEHKLDDGICVTCAERESASRSEQPEHEPYLVDGICESCSDEEPLSEAEQALVTALAELDSRSVDAARSWDPAKHPRGPGGQFRSIVDRLKDAIDSHQKGHGGAHPFDGYSREQLRRVAKARGVAVPRGAPRDHISQLLLGDLTGKPKVHHPGHADPQVAAALDILHGVDPKAFTASHQLVVYGQLRRSHFAQMGADEQTTLLGDLAYIATISKGPNGKQAQKLIDRFSPPGTKPGHVPVQAVIPPAGAVAGQTRVADLSGTAGLLTIRKDRGVSGDGWFRMPDGSTGPWGQYGAAGVMLRHVGADGEERFLVVQRGPGISDPGKWQFPGGAIDSKENPYEGAARETVEELGLDAADIAAARVHGTHEVSIAGGWKYTSIAATVDTQLVPDLSTHHARAETSDAKWMTRGEIDALDQQGKLLKPLAGGQLQSNVMTLFPPAARPGARPPRIGFAPPKPPKPSHKPSKGRDLLTSTAATNQLRQDVKMARAAFDGKTADGRLAAIGAMQGFDDTPTVVSSAEMDRLLKTGDYIEAWRGVQGAGSYGRGPGRGGAVSSTKSAADIHEEFRSGPAYYGNGIFGNGYYFATQKSVAEGYGDGTKGSVLRVLIPKKAKIVDHATIQAEARANASPSSKAKGHRHEDGTLYDEGRYAAAKGYDMIEISHSYSSSHVASPGKPAYTVLNRSVLVVEEG